MRSRFFMKPHPYIKVNSDIETDEHLTCIYHFAEERKTVLFDFIKKGLDVNDKIVFIGEDELVPELIKDLENAEIFAGDNRKREQLSSFAGEGEFLKNEEPVANQIFEYLKFRIRSFQDEGYDLLRLALEMSMLRPFVNNSHAFIEFEGKILSLLQNTPCVVLFLYDRRQFDPGIIMDVLSTRPVVLLGAELFDNHYNLSREEFLGSGGREAELNQRLNNLYARKKEVINLQKKSEELEKRIRELHCLYAITDIVEQKGIVLEEILQKIAETIPSGLKYPQSTGVRLTIGEKVYTTSGFKNDGQTHSVGIRSNEQNIGFVEASYPGSVLDKDEKRITEDERKFLESIAKRLGRIVERIFAQEELRRSETRYRELANHVADGVAIMKGGVLEFVNKAFFKTLGFTSEDEVLGISPDTFIVEESKQTFRDMVADLTSGRNRKCLFRGGCLTTQGQNLWVEIRMNRITWKKEPAILGTIRDVTERHLRDIAIRKETEYLRRENLTLRSSMKERFRFGNLVGKSPSMQEVYELILKAGASDAGVIIFGESGTGKELVASAIHQISDRRKNAFVPVNCGAVPESILEREFFGHKKGAFTGADTDIHGYLDLADEGSLFLDEVGELALNMQVKLLRALDGAGYMPVGSNRMKNSDFRIIAASNRDLKKEASSGRMREDFFYRIHVIPIYIPPLRERKEDIPLLIDHFLSRLKHEDKPPVTGRILEMFSRYDWPGNVRELQNALHRYVTLKEIDFLEDSSSSSVDVEFSYSDWDGGTFQEAMDEFERGYILAALEKNRWHRGKTSRMLGLPSRTLYRKMKKSGLI